MKIDGKDILARLRKEPSDRTKISFYLSKSLYRDFRKACGNVPAYRVVEELLRAFIGSVRGTK